jgi:hypothetical protein
MLTKPMLLVLAFLPLGGCTGTTSSLSIPTTAPKGALEQIPATIFKSDGPGPFPAVVIMHDGSGLSLIFSTQVRYSPFLKDFSRFC